MIERRLVYSISVQLSLAERPTKKQQDALALAVIEALQREGVAFYVGEDNEMVKFQYVKTLESVTRLQ